MAARSSSAWISAGISPIHAPIPDSLPAWNFNLSAPRRGDISRRCSRAVSRCERAGAWCHAAM
jgi:hypothetical protein